MNPRQASVAVLQQVIQHGHSLTDSLNVYLVKLKPADRPLCQAICFGVLRHYHRLDFLLNQLLSKPLRNKDQDIHCLLLIGLYQLLEMRIPDHAAVSQTVAVSKSLRKNWARELVNGILRNFQRRQDELMSSLEEAGPDSIYSHPSWFISRLQQAWPDDWQTILLSNNRQAPMSLRVNALHTTREAYLARLDEQGVTARVISSTQNGIQLEQAAPVEALAGFTEGDISVQDGAAQLATELLDAQAGERVLDACAAPGGKTAHILESRPGLAELVAIDVSPDRLLRVSENLQRLGLQATLLGVDASEPGQWWDGNPFDRILLDAPCSASGVIRRHPDIKLLRRDSDIENLVALQHKLLRQLWPLLNSGGMLLYATCSVLPEENHLQIQQFLAEQPDAVHQPIAASWGRPMQAGRQILTGEEEMDGFYYACIHKQTA